MVNVADLAITSLDIISAFGMDGTPRFIMDELQNANIAHSEEKQEIIGKAGRKLNSLKKNKAVTITGTNGLISAGMLEAQVGNTFESGVTVPVKAIDYLTVKSNKAVTNFKAVGTAGAEIEGVYVKDSTGAAGSKLEQADTAADGKFAYNPATKELTFASGVLTDGTEIVVFYTRNVTGNKLTNYSDNYSEKLQLYIDGTAEDKCGLQYRVQFYIPKADFSGNFEIALGGDQAVHAFEAESLAGSCGAGGGLWTYTVFGVDAADVA